MFGEQVIDCLIQNSGAASDMKALAAILLRIPASGNSEIDTMIRKSCVMDSTRQLALASLAGSGGQKEPHKVVARELQIAQHVEMVLERLVQGHTRAE